MDNDNKPRPHAELIKAWADGAIIQGYDKDEDKWFDYCGLPASFLSGEDNPTIQYRIKPWEPEYDEKYFYVDSAGTVVQTGWVQVRIDYARLAVGNLFLCKDEAVAAAERVKAALKGEGLEGEKTVLHPHLNGKPVSDGELALIRAIRKTDVSYVWQRKGAILVDKEDFAAHGDFIAFLTGGEYTANDEIRAALNAISREQEQEASNDVS